MSRLSAPGAIALLAAAGAGAALPAVAARIPPAVLAALALLLALALLAASRPLWPAGLLGAGALLVVAGLGYDAVRGFDGVLQLAEGQGESTFDERGPGGESLGLRPFGFSVRLLEVRDGRRALLEIGGGEQAELGPGAALARRGFRLGDPKVGLTGGASRLRVAVSGPPGAQEADLVPGATAEVFDLLIAVDEYYPDFALGADQKPFTRSLEPNNPAAVLRVGRGGQVWRVFVMRAMPGVHRPEGLGYSLSMVSVEPERQVTIGVHRQPAAFLVPSGLALLGAGLALGAARGRSTGA